MKTFEEYLEDVCFFDEKRFVLGKDKTESFDEWLEQKDKESLFIYSEGWGRHIKSYILREVTKITN